MKKNILGIIILTVAIVATIGINTKMNMKQSSISLLLKNAEALANPTEGGGSKVDCWHWISRSSTATAAERHTKRQCSDCKLYLDVTNWDLGDTCVFN